MLQEWNNRKSKEIIGSTIGDLYNYQLLIVRINKSIGIDSIVGTNNTIQNIYVGTKTKDNFSDVRFTDINDNLLDYFMKDIVYGIYADFVIKIPSIIAYPNITTIYIYYNNPNALILPNNGNTTFVKFDDFEAYNLGSITNQGDWVIRIVGGSAGFAEVRLLNNRKHLAFNSSSIDNPDNYQTTIMTPNILSNNTSVGVRHRFEIQNNHFILGFCNYEIETRGRPRDAYQCYFASDLIPPTGYMVRRINNSSTIMQTITDSQELSKYYDLELSWYNGNIKALRDGNIIGLYTDSTFNSLSHINISAYSVPSISYINYIYVRQYVEPEPSWGNTGMEETRTEECPTPLCTFNITSTGI